jgi:hypothetical protein
MPQNHTLMFLQYLRKIIAFFVSVIRLEQANCKIDYRASFEMNASLKVTALLLTRKRLSY